jgi:two-component system phosphate regulon response regulator PhoB
MGKQILIVDDDSTVTGFYSRYLSLEGYSVTVAETCAAASALLVNWRPDLIVVDWWMPDADGDVWATSLRLRSDLARVPIILVTGRDLPRASINRLTDYHITRCQKPFSLEAFSATLARLLRSPVAQAVGDI